MALAAGTIVQGYEILAPIGAGGMGEVYRARDLALKREVAIKVLPGFVLKDPDRLRRFEQEAQAAAALNHPNILAVYQFGSFEGSPYLVAELLTGSTLREMLERGPLPLRKIIDIGVQIDHGLAAAHAKGIVHRDLKPENLFVTKDGRAKILDFGLAKLMDPQAGADMVSGPTRTMQTDPGVVMGTAGYMSPEQVRGAAIDHRTDIFSFGAILYEMLTGRRAFQRPTSAETMTAILNEDPPSISTIAVAAPPGLQRVIHRCLEKSPEQRFQSASDLAFALEALSDSGSSAAVPVQQQFKSSRWMWPSVAAAILIVLAIGVAIWWRMPAAVPVIESVTQLTDDGEPKNGNLGSDSSRVYLDEGPLGITKIVQVSINGGSTALVPTKLQNAQLQGVIPDGSALLSLAGFSLTTSTYPLWVIPLPAGEPRRVGDRLTQNADIFPDGRVIYEEEMYGKAADGDDSRTDWFITDKDMANPRKLISLQGNFGLVSVSPDGEHILLSEVHGPVNKLLEISPDGTHLREIRNIAENECCFTWSADQKYLVYLVYNEEVTSDIWAMPLDAGFLHHNAKPVRLTFGPLPYSHPQVSRDGKHIFAIGTKRRGEVVHYDLQSHQFQPMLSGISATDPTFSRDGKTAAYVSYPDHTLWRSRGDGSDPVQLTHAPMVAYWAYISPDGQKISFSSDYKVFLIDANGGEPQKIVDSGAGAVWSPDGTRLAFNSNYGAEIYDLRTKTISRVPGGGRFVGPLWIAQDALVAASPDAKRFYTFDFKTQKWSDFVQGSFVNWMVSPDYKFLYVTTAGPDSQVERIRFADRQIEPIASLKDLHRVVNMGVTDLKIGPDGSPIFTRDIGSQEVYSLKVQWPR